MAQQKTEQTGWVKGSSVCWPFVFPLLFFRLGEGTIELYIATRGNNPIERRSWRVRKARRGSGAATLSCWALPGGESTQEVSPWHSTQDLKKMILIFPNFQGHEDGKPWEFKMLKDAYYWTLCVWDAEILSASKTILLTDLLTIPFKNPQILSLFDQLFL